MIYDLIEKWASAKGLRPTGEFSCVSGSACTLGVSLSVVLSDAGGECAEFRYSAGPSSLFMTYSQLSEDVAASLDRQYAARFPAADNT